MIKLLVFSHRHRILDDEVWLVLPAVIFLMGFVELILKFADRLLQGLLNALAIEAESS